MMLLVTHLVLQEVRAEKKEGWKPFPAAAEVGGSKTQPDLCRNAHRTSSPQEALQSEDWRTHPADHAAQMCFIRFYRVRPMSPEHQHQE